MTCPDTSQPHRSIGINERVSVPLAELEFRFSGSGGPGGQNVNKRDTRVSLRFDIGASSALTEDDRQRVRKRLANRISRDDVLQIVAATQRTQAGNRAAAVARFAELMRRALKSPRKRKATRVPKRQRAVRREEKARRADKKRLRSRPQEHD